MVSIASVQMNSFLREALVYEALTVSLRSVSLTKEFGKVSTDKTLLTFCPTIFPSTTPYKTPFF